MEKLARQLSIKYAFLQSAYWISACIFSNFAAVYLHYKNFSNTQIGIIFSLSSLFCIILQPLISSFADKTKKISLRWIVIFLMLTVFLAAFLLYLIPDFVLLITILYIYILMILFTLIPLLNSLAFEHMNKGIPMNFGLSRGTGSIAFAVVSFFLGIAVNRYGAGILILLFLCSTCFMILSAYIFRIKNPIITSESIVNAEPSTIDQPIHTDTSSTAVPSSVLGFFLLNKRFTVFLIGVSMIFYTHNLLNTYLINIIENVGGNSADMGLSLTIAAFLELPTMASFMLLVKRIKCNTLIKISAFFFLIKVLIAWLAPVVSVVHLSQGFQSLAFALFTPASVFYVNAIIAKEDRIKGQSMLGVATLGLSGAIANITGGKILDTLGVSDMLMLGTAVSAIGFLVICFSTQNVHGSRLTDHQ